MRIALFASAFHPYMGGVEELCRQLAHAWQRAGHEVIVLTNRWPRSLPRAEVFEGIPVYRLAFRMPEDSLKSRVTYRLTHKAIVRETVEILRRHKTDVVQVQCVSANGWYAHLAAQALRRPLVVTAQGERTMDATRVYERSPFLNRVLRGLLEEADFVTACSADTLADIERYHGLPLGERGSVIYNGADLEAVAGAVPHLEERPYVLAIGRHVPQKGFDVLLRAWAQARPAGWRLVLAGDGTEHAALKELVAQLGLTDDEVKFTGAAARPLAAALFKGCEFFVLPSRHEPLGIVNLEAMAAGKAVIASRVGGVPEIVLEGETGLLVPPEDEAALAEAIVQLASDAPLRKRLGDAGAVHARRFSWDALAEQYVALYRRALEGGSVPPEAAPSSTRRPAEAPVLIS